MHMEKNIQVSDFYAIYTKTVGAQGRVSLPKEFTGHRCIVLIEHPDKKSKTTKGGK